MANAEMANVIYTYHDATPDIIAKRDALLARIYKAPFEAQHTLLQFHTKCTEGGYCQNPNCICLHPNQDRWMVGFVKRIAAPCPLMINNNSCPLRCGSDEGYCPYQHCTHNGRPTLYNEYNLWDGSYCGKDECVGHCNDCGLATVDERNAVRQGWWAENR